MKYKLIAIDLDDTLLAEKSGELQVSQRNKEALKAAMDKGVKVVISTGRMFSSSLPYLLDIGLKGESITYNGALVRDIETGEIIEHNPVPLGYSKDIIDFVKKKDLHINFYIDDILYVNKMEEEAKCYERLSGVTPVLIKEDLETFLDIPSTKMLVVELDEDKSKELLAEFKENFGEHLHITPSKPIFVEVMGKGVSKGSTIARLAQRYGIKQEEVIAIGDSSNDLEMVEYAGLGVAVDNARDSLKEKADYITKANFEDGVAYVIEKFIL
ncbi:Cof-type HAD-IIB family hydrolase [Halonatronum saccharophilum]|uniref:Cof-type HAD-IIB family hydrolase n=1 Tax=Halonatronum saccharophilum TaxID=150060 RepID=UPI000480FD55|nr:Cof-type HAD-IIB family hydrolase [Halonatronum saccharophilum]